MSFIRRSTMLAVVAALAFGLSACEEPVQKPASVVLSRDVAATLASPVGIFMGTLLNMLSSPANSFGPSVEPAKPPLPPPPAPPPPSSTPSTWSRSRAAAARLAAATEPSADCITWHPEVPVDRDGDEIPQSLTISFNCSDASTNTAGTIVVKDKDDTDPDSGFSADVDLRIDDSDDRSTLDFDFVVDVSRRASSGTALAYDISYAGNISFEIPGVALKASYDLDMRHEGMFTAGVISLDGSFGYSWDVDCSKATGELADCRSLAQSIGNKGAIQLTIKASRLEYDTESCETAVTNGTVAMRDSTGNVAEIRYTGCDQATVTYNGEPL